MSPRVSLPDSVTIDCGPDHRAIHGLWKTMIQDPPLGGDTGWIGLTCLPHSNADLPRSNKCVPTDDNCAKLQSGQGPST